MVRSVSFLVFVYVVPFHNYFHCNYGVSPLPPSLSSVKMNHFTLSSKSLGVIFMYLLLLLLMLFAVSNAIPTDITDVSEDKCAHIKCPTENECPNDSEWQTKTTYTSEEIDYQADNIPVVSSAATAIEEQQYIEEEGYESIVHAEDNEDEENYENVEIHNNRFDDIRNDAIDFNDSISRCCRERKCVCKSCPKPKCALKENFIEIHRGLGLPGKCCGIYKCIPEVKCDGVHKSEHYFWRNACTKCKCFGGEDICERLCPNTEPEKHLFGNCLSKANLSMEHGSTWFEDGNCSECTCEHGDAHCIGKLCNNAILDCKHPIKLPGKCCPECPDETISGIDVDKETEESVETDVDTSPFTETTILFSTESSTVEKSSILVSEITTSAFGEYENSTSVATISTESISSISENDDLSTSSSTSSITEIDFDNSTTTDGPLTTFDSSTMSSPSVEISSNFENISGTYGATETTVETIDTASSTNEVSAFNTVTLSPELTSFLNNSASFNEINQTEDTSLRNIVGDIYDFTSTSASPRPGTLQTEIETKSKTSTSTEIETEDETSPTTHTASSIQSTIELNSSTESVSPSTTEGVVVSANIDNSTTSIYSTSKVEFITSAPKISSIATDTVTENPILTTSYTQVTHASTTTSAPAPLEPQPTVYRQLNNDDESTNTQNGNRFPIIFGSLILFAVIAFIAVTYWACRTKSRRQVYSAIPKSETLGYNTGVVTIATTADLNNYTKERKYYSTTPKSECSLSANSTSASVLTVESG